MDDLLRNTLVGALTLAAVCAALLAGCDEPRPVTVLFTGDEQGRLVPAG